MSFFRVILHALRKPSKKERCKLAAAVHRMAQQAKKHKTEYAKQKKHTINNLEKMITLGLEVVQMIAEKGYFERWFYNTGSFSARLPDYERYRPYVHEEGSVKYYKSDIEPSLLNSLNELAGASFKDFRRTLEDWLSSECLPIEQLSQPKEFLDETFYSLYKLGCKLDERHSEINYNYWMSG